MSNVIRLLNTVSLNKRCTREQWLELGQPVIIGNNLTLTVIRVLDGDSYIFDVLIKGPGIHEQHKLPPGGLLKMVDWTGMYAMPRAVQMDEKGRPNRVMLTFLAVSEKAQRLFAQPVHKQAQ